MYLFNNIGCNDVIGVLKLEDEDRSKKEEEKKEADEEEEKRKLMKTNIILKMCGIRENQNIEN